MFQGNQNGVAIDVLMTLFEKAGEEGAVPR
jgi:hypothetical protein